MKPLQITLAVIAIVILTTQSIRHTYRLYFEPRHSALDKFDTPEGGPVSEARSLEELVTRYEPLRKEADRIRKERAAQKKEYDIDYQTEPFKSEETLKAAIVEWETKANQIRELRIYWSAGFILILLGLVAYRRAWAWFGMSMLIAGFSEMIYWTCPELIGWGTREADRLLINKLIFSVLSLVVLAIAIAATHAFQPRSTNASR